MKITSNIDAVQKNILIAQKQVAFATSRTINDLLYGIKDRSLKQFENIFDRPNMNFLKRSFYITKSTKQNLMGTIAISEKKFGKGSSPIDVLGHQINPAARSNRRFENLMKRNGFMGKNMYALPSRSAGPNVIDRYGGISGKFSSWIISYLGLYDKAGFKANMTAKKKAKIKGLGKTERGYKTINGAEYFMSSGKEGFVGKRNHLQAGIWKKSGIHGVDVVPVILFFKNNGPYKKRFFFEELANGYVEKYATETFKKNLSNALSTSSFK